MDTASTRIQCTYCVMLLFDNKIDKDKCVVHVGACK